MKDPLQQPEPEDDGREIREEEFRAAELLRGFFAETRPVPSELDARVALGLTEPIVRVARQFAQLESEPAPANLDQAVQARIGHMHAEKGAPLEAWERSSALAFAFQELEPVPAPPVLARLVEEELRDPEAARAKRFLGSLPRKQAPRELESRLRRLRLDPLRRWFAPLGLLAAALLFLVGIRSLTAPERPEDGIKPGPGSELAQDAPRPGARWSFRVESLVEPEQLGAAGEAYLGAFGGFVRSRAASEPSPGEGVEDARPAQGNGTSVERSSRRPVVGPPSDRDRESSQAASGSGAPAGAGAMTVLSIPKSTDVLHGGDRLVQMMDWSAPGGPTLVSYREHMLADGSGRFSLEPVESVLGLDTVWPLFALGQARRMSLLAHYRGFAIRDPARFRLNWTVTDRDRVVTVAGRLSERYDVTHQDTGRRFELALDAATGLILKQEEFDAVGTLVFALEYETFETTPDLSSVVWHRPLVVRTLDLDTQTELEFHPDIHVPTALPAGYALDALEVLDTSTLQDPEGTWLRMTFTDGVDPLLYLISLAGSSGSADLANGGVVRMVELGFASCAVGDLPPGRVIAVGRVPADQLSDLLESALP